MSGLMTPESLSREGSPAPPEQVILSTTASPEAQVTTLEVKNSDSFPGGQPPHFQQLKLASGQQIQLATQPGLQLVTGQQQFQLATAQPGQQLQLATAQPGQQLQLGQPLQLATGQQGQKVIVAGPAGHPRLIVPAHQLAVLTNGGGPGGPGGGARAEPNTRAPTRIVSVSQGGVSQPVSQAGQIVGQTMMTTRPLGKAIVTSQTPVLLQPAHSQISTATFMTPPEGAGVKRLYTSTPTIRTEYSQVYERSGGGGTPIPPGTQIILSEGVAGGVTRLSSGGVARLAGGVSLPQHPLPPDPPRTSQMRTYTPPTSITSGSVVVTPTGSDPPAPPPPPPVPTVSVSMVEVQDMDGPESSEEGLESQAKRIKLETAVVGH